MSESITSMLQENRIFEPSEHFRSHIGPIYVPDLKTYHEMYRRSIDDPASFWGDVAKDFHWYRPWKKVVDWNVPDAKWFVDGTTNVCANCVDRQVENGHGDEPGDSLGGRTMFT